MPFTSCAAHVALGGLTALGWLGLGSVLLAPVRRSGDLLLDTLNRLGVGAIAFALLTFAAGLAGMLYTALYVPTVVVFALAGARDLPALWRAAPRARPAEWPRWHRALVLLLVVTVVLAVIAACAPITTFDALHYHASAPARYVESHRLLEIPWSWSSYQPFTVEMLVTDGFLLRDSVQGAFAPLLLALAALVTVVGAGVRVGGRGLGLLAGAIFFVQPLLILEATGTLVETGLALASALAVWNAAVALKQDDRAALALAGLFAGAAAGMKYIGIFVLLSVAAALLLFVGRRLTPAMLAVFAVPVAVALPWYVKNAVQTGNPLHPFVFGGVNEHAERWIASGLQEHGDGRRPVDAVLLPFRLLAVGDDFDRGSWLSPLPLIFAPLALLDPRRRRGSELALSAVLVYVAAWFATSQQARFLLPLAPVLAVLAGIGAFALARRGRLGRIAASLAVGAALFTGFVMSAVYTTQFIPVALGLQDRGAFLAAKTPYFDGVTWLNRGLGADDVVLLDFSAVLYMGDAYVVWTPVVLPIEAGPEETRRVARENGLTHAAILEVNLAARRPQLRVLGARPIAVVPVRVPVFGLRITAGVPERLHVFELGRS